MEQVNAAHLAKLAKLSLTPAEVAQYEHEISEILGYIHMLSEVAGDAPEVIESAGVRNVFRDDVCTIPTGTYTDVLLDAAPDTQDGFIKVQKILDTGHGA